MNLTTIIGLVLIGLGVAGFIYEALTDDYGSDRLNANEEAGENEHEWD